MTQNTQDEVVGSIGAALFLATLFILILTCWAPASYFLGKWFNYWDSKNNSTLNVNVTPGDGSYFEGWSKADQDCSTRAKNFYKAPALTVQASSTSGNYQTYDCYALKYTKIP